MTGQEQVEEFAFHLFESWKAEYMEKDQQYPAYLKNLAKASALIRNGHSQEAIPILNDIIEIDPHCSFAIKERGHAKMFSQDVQGAIVDFTDMIRRWPTNTKGYTGRAATRALREDWRKGLLTIILQRSQ